MDNQASFVIEFKGILQKSKLLKDAWLPIPLLCINPNQFG